MKNLLQNAGSQIHFFRYHFFHFYEGGVVPSKCSYLKPRAYDYDNLTPKCFSSNCESMTLCGYAVQFSGLMKRQSLS